MQNPCLRKIGWIFVTPHFNNFFLQTFQVVWNVLLKNAELRGSKLSPIIKINWITPKIYFCVILNGVAFFKVDDHVVPLQISLNTCYFSIMRLV
jgi:hypothetical protein